MCELGKLRLHGLLAHKSRTGSIKKSAVLVSVLLRIGIERAVMLGIDFPGRLRWSRCDIDCRRVKAAFWTRERLICNVLLPEY